MKCFWSVMIAVAMTVAGVAWGGPVRADGFVAATPAGVGNGFRFQKVHDRDHRGHWGGRRDRDGHVHARIFLGFGNAWDPYWGPYWGAPPPYYYYSPPVVVTQPQPPTVYISPDQQRRPYYWYYCESAKLYYPYVKQCPGGWMKVVPREPRNQ